ncbi:DUF3048 domain-containing protein [Lentibacillus sp. N15]|uniref:DUF3048 domain-containing protein n=1 Tax=Lentibacillus songyuanensis TaxID=3136161 RepID=UPI0031B9D467
MKKVFLLFMALLVVLMAGCTKDKEQSDSNKKSREKTDQSEKGDIYPLTGLQADGSTDRRAVGVMVNNHRKARPQTGLSKADIVFEILAEGQITRFLALFQSEEPDVVGPVRSAREYYFELAKGYDTLYVYHGAANFVNDMIDERGIEHIDGALHDNDGTLFKRASSRKPPHNSYLQFDAVDDAAKEKGYDIKSKTEPLPFLTKDEVDQLSGNEAQHVRIDYSLHDIMNVVEFDYDTDNEKYIRFSDREKTVELDTNEPIQVDNVFIVETAHKIIDDEGRRAVDIESGGDALLVQKGHVQQVQWENIDGRIIPVKNGDPVGLVPGKTWINVIPEQPGIHDAVTISN